MQKYSLVFVICLALFLTGCSNESVEEPVVETELRQVTTNAVWDNRNFDSITPVCAFESTDECLKIFPYNNSEEYIKVEKILISSNGFWNTVTNEFKDTNNVRVLDNYSYITTSSKVTIGYYALDDEYAYIVSTETLPSSYVEKVLEMLWITST